METVDENIDQIISRYAEKAEGIYSAQTAGEFTWQGLLASMLMDIKKAGITL